MMASGQPEFEPVAPTSESAKESDNAEVQDAKILDEVLKETLSVTSEDQHLDAAEMEALRAIARAHFEPELTLDPVLVELVRTILKRRVDVSTIDPHLWDSMTRTVAETLWYDPPSRERIEGFWARLREAIS